VERAATRLRTTPMNKRARMTDRQRARRKRQGKVGPKSVIAVGMATVVVFLSLLGLQVAAGKDPALGHGWQKRKVVHRTVKHYVIRRIVVQPTVDNTYSGGSSSSSSNSSGSYSSGGSSSYSAPSYSAPSYSPPAPAVSSGASGG
jgi:uncharacterized membrane protein YgcG